MHPHDKHAVSLSVTSQTKTRNCRPIQAVMFDLGDTLFEPLARSHLEKNLLNIAVETPLKTTPDELLRVFRATRTKLEAELSNSGFYLHRTFIGKVVSRLFDSMDHTLPRKLVHRFCDSQRDAVVAHLRPRPDCFETLAQLRKMGFKLAIVSNIDNEWFNPLRSKWRLDDFVDVCLSSESARSCKPDETIFEKACTLTAVTPGDTVFVGDSQLNDFFGSENVGMRPIWYDANGQSTVESVVSPKVTSLIGVIKEIQLMLHH